MNPEFFVDGIHFSEDGVRLQAWIVLQSLLPVVRERVKSGEWPRKARSFLLEHPYIGEPKAVNSPCDNLADL